MIAVNQVVVTAPALHADIANACASFDLLSHAGEQCRGRGRPAPAQSLKRTKRPETRCAKPRNAEKTWRLLCRRHNVIGMITVLFVFVSLLAFRLRGRASLKLELIALRHQLTVLRRQRPRHPRLFAVDWLLWVWPYRICPQVLDAMVLFKPTTRRPVAP